MDLSWVSLPPVSDPALAEWLEPAGQYLSGDDARQAAAATLARDQGGWPA